MNENKLTKTLTDHKKWLDGEGCQRANLQDANLRGANLQDADLQDADLQRANLQDANLRGANLQDANLQDANLRGANLRDANLDFSCWPLWCGSLNAKIDENQFRQLLYHVIAVAPDKAFFTGEQIDEANKFHQVLAGEVKHISQAMPGESARADFERGGEK